jgi:hypothetical protein
MKKYLFLALIFLMVGCVSQPPIAPALSHDQIMETAFAQVAGTQTALVPTATFTPVTTATPTNTPLPTQTNTPPPTPIILNGIGASVVDVQKWNGPALARIKHVGFANFAVWNYGANGDKIDLLVNTIGNYDGTLPLDWFDDEDTIRFEIKADGNWEIQILPFDSIRKEAYPGIIQGIGDDVVAIQSLETGKKPDILKANATQSGNFAIWAWSGKGRDLLINEIAPYTGTIIIGQETRILVITATGNWSLEITAK